MNVQAHTDLAAFDALRDEWNALLFGSPHDRLFLTWEWQSIWWAVYAPGELLLVTVRNDEGRLVGLAPWYKDTDGVVRPIGGEDVTDYEDVIVRPGVAEAVYQALAAYLAEADLTLNLPNIPAASPTLDIWPSQLEAHGYELTIETNDVCPVIDLPDSFPAYLDGLDKKQRHEIRRKLRRARGADIDWYIVGDNHSLKAETDIFLKLMASAHPDKATFLENPAHVSFFKRIIPAMKEAGWLQMAILTYEGQPSAAYLNFDYGNTILVYNSGFDVEVGGAFSPGIVLLAHLINHAIEQRRHRFDLLRGGEEYKYRIGGQDTEVLRLTARR